ncbi:MAG: hypothetical protein LUD17_08120 [Bacteroidales bacterium]|nr:hypothetical protein [Bacteroidales bacterium]
MEDFDGFGDIVEVMKVQLSKRNDPTLQAYKASDFSETYLFFDYDFHHSQLTIAEINRQLKEMLEYFNEETENGKLYINYPMVESIRYVKSLPDPEYLDYTVTRVESKNFKRLCAEFTGFGSYDFLLLPETKEIPQSKIETIKENWKHLIAMNIQKANHLVGKGHRTPNHKEDINQRAILKSQIEHFVLPFDSVSVLNSFPIFLYEYLK